MDEKLELLDYKNCIANLPNSILKYFGVDMVGEPLGLADRYLKKRYKNVVVLLLDAMGKNVLGYHLKEDGFFRRHFAEAYHSVFPPTTVAATTSIQTGLQPIEHGWLGWDEYFPELDKNVTVFLNTEQGTDRQAASENVISKYFGYESVVEKLNKAGKKAYNVTPFVEPHPNTFEAICQSIEDHCREAGEKYIYAYWPEPDHTMHQLGAYSKEAGSILADLEAQVEALSHKLKDTLLIITADHGHINGRNVAITDYPRIMDCLVRMPSIESRALNLYIKADKKEQFEDEFNKEFGKDFLLLTKEQVYEKGLFGTGKPHAGIDAGIGDYVAISTTDLTIFNSKEQAEDMKGVHAGYTLDEMMIPFIAVET